MKYNHWDIWVSSAKNKKKQKPTKTNKACLVTWQQHCALSFGRSQSQLVEGHYLTACLQDPAADTIGYSQGADLWDNKRTWGLCQKLTTTLHFSGEKKANMQILTLSLGMSWILTSSVTVPTTTAVLFSRPGIFILRIWLQWKQSQQFSMHINKSEQLTTGLNWQGSYTFNFFPGITVLIRLVVNGKHDASRYWLDYMNNMRSTITFNFLTSFPT